MQDKIKYPEADYYGEVNSNCEPHGKGKMDYKNGEQYEGTFDKGLMHGVGVYKWPSGIVYIGSFNMGKEHGRATLSCADYFFKGLYYKGKRNGQGRIEYTNGDFKDGEWKNNEFMHGKIRLTNDNGYIYEGECLNGKRHGVGKIFNQKYEITKDGLFENGEFASGNQTLTTDSGVVYKGNTDSGYAKATYPNGDFKDGLWKNNEFTEGKVRLTNDNGNIYEGEYLNGKRHGLGKLFNLDGTIKYEGQFLFGIDNDWYQEIEAGMNSLVEKNGYKKKMELKPFGASLLSFFTKPKPIAEPDTVNYISLIQSKYISKDYDGSVRDFVYLFYSEGIYPMENDKIDVIIKFLKSLEILFGINDKIFYSLLIKFYNKNNHIELDRMVADHLLYGIKDLVDLFGKTDNIFMGKKLFSDKDSSINSTTDKSSEPAFRSIEQYIRTYNKLGFKDEAVDLYHNTILEKISNTEAYWEIGTSSSNRPKNKDGSLDKRYNKNK
jgi:hypothetical protein